MPVATPNTDKPRVLLIGPLPPPFIGPAVATQRLLISPVIQSAFTISFLNMNDPDGLEGIGRLNWHNIRTALSHGWQCLKILVRARPAVLYIPIDRALWGFLRDLLFIVPGRLLGASIVIHLRAGRHDLQHDFGALGRLIARLGLWGVCRAIVLGETVRDVFGGLVPADRVRVVPNGMDLDGWDAALWQSEREAHTGPFHIAYVANLYRDKGAHIMLAALPAILKSVPRLRVTFAGQWMDEPFRQECMDFVRRNNLEPYVQFPGPVDDAAKKQLLRTADMAAFVPVKPEGLPWVVLEAMAAGLPIVGSPQGTMKEVIVDDHTGFLVPESDPAAVARCVTGLAGDPARRARMGRQARLRVEQIYAEPVTHQKLVQVLNEACNSHTN